jgi:AhpD family alkylhydroperoxidase
VTTVQVFDPALCCDTGVCGATVDQQLVRFGEDLEWLKAQGVVVERFNLADQPEVFVADLAVKAAVASKGEFGLPVVKVNGEVRSCGVYPSRAELAAWVGIAAPTPSIFTDEVAELVAIGAAIASNCELCFRSHYDKARKLGVTPEDMWSAVTIGQSVKETPAKAVLTLAQRYLRRDESGKMLQVVSEEAGESSAGGSCCSSGLPAVESQGE